MGNSAHHKRHQCVSKHHNSTPAWKWLNITTDYHCVEATSLTCHHCGECCHFWTPVWRTLLTITGHQFEDYCTPLKTSVWRKLHTTTRHQYGEHCAPLQDTIVGNLAHNSCTPVCKIQHTTSRHQCSEYFTPLMNISVGNIAQHYWTQAEG